MDSRKGQYGLQSELKDSLGNLVRAPSKEKVKRGLKMSSSGISTCIVCVRAQIQSPPLKKGGRLKCGGGTSSGITTN